MLITATATMAVAMVTLGLTRPSVPLPTLIVILMVIGASRSTGATGYMTVTYADVPKSEMRHATTLQTTLQMLAAGAGIALSTIALRIGHIFTAQGGAHTEYLVAFSMMACISLLATLEASRMHSGAGEALRVRRQPRDQTQE